MEVKGLAWLGTRTRKFEDTTRFFRDTLGLRAEHEEPDFVVFRLPNTHFETGPVVGFLVDDVEEARARLEAAGISFIGPVHSAEDGGTWSHFVGPDGNVYELTGERPPT